MCAKDLQDDISKMKTKTGYLYDQGLGKDFLSKALEVQTKDKQLIVFWSVKDLTDQVKKPDRHGDNIWHL